MKDTTTDTRPATADRERRIITVSLNEDTPGGMVYLTALGANVVFTASNGHEGFTMLLLDGVKTALPGCAPSG